MVNGFAFTTEPRQFNAKGAKTQRKDIFSCYTAQRCNAGAGFIRHGWSGAERHRVCDTAERCHKCELCDLCAFASFAFITPCREKIHGWAPGNRYSISRGTAEWCHKCEPCVSVANRLHSGNPRASRGSRPLRPMALRARACLSGGSRSVATRPRLRARLSGGKRLAKVCTKALVKPMTLR